MENDGESPGELWVSPLMMGMAVGVWEGDCSHEFGGAGLGIDTQLIVGLLPVQVFSTYFGFLKPEILKNKNLSESRDP